MAGEIYIADKATLDSVKTSVDSSNTKLDNLKTGIAGTLSVSDLNNKLIVNYKSVSSTSTVLNVNSPGTLYYVLGGASTNAKMKVTVDGTVIYYRTIPETNLRAGIIYDPTGLVESTIRITPSGAFKIAEISALPPTSTVAGQGHLVIPKPLKFNSFSIYVDCSDTTSISYMYVLD